MFRVFLLALVVAVIAPTALASPWTPVGTVTFAEYNASTDILWVRTTPEAGNPQSCSNSDWLAMKPSVAENEARVLQAMIVTAWASGKDVRFRTTGCSAGGYNEYDTIELN